MAKLSARGRYELIRMSRERNTEPKDKFDTCWEKKTYCLMSDGHTLLKWQVKWPDGNSHDYGWKDKGKAEKTVDQFRDILLKAGYEVVS